MYDLSGFERDILYVVNGNNGVSGADLKDELGDYRPVHDNQVYPALQSLEAAGLVRVKQEDGRTNNYKITPRGRRELQRRQDWEDEHEPPADYTPPGVGSAED